MKAVMKRNLVNIDRHSLFVDILVEFVCNHPPLLMICCLMLLRKAVQHQRSSMTPLPGSVTCPKHSNICHHTKIKKIKNIKDKNTNIQIRDRDRDHELRIEVLKTPLPGSVASLEHSHVTYLLFSFPGMSILSAYYIHPWWHIYA